MRNRIACEFLLNFKQI